MFKRKETKNKTVMKIKDEQWRRSLELDEKTLIVLSPHSPSLLLLFKLLIFVLRMLQSFLFFSPFVCFYNFGLLWK